MLRAGASALAAPALNEAQATLQASLVSAGLSPEAARASARAITGAIAVALGGGVGGVTGAAASANQDFNNRLMRTDEKERIKQLAGGDQQKEERLLAAACAMVRCADGVPRDDKAYADLRALQAYGNTLTEEKQRLWQQGNDGSGLFDYQSAAGDWASRNKVDVRVAGTVQAVAGAMGAAASVTAGCSNPLTCGAATVAGGASVDYMLAGVRQAGTGEAVTPMGEQVLQSLGLTPGQAALGYGALGAGSALTQALAAAKMGQAAQAGVKGEWRLSPVCFRKYWTRQRQPVVTLSSLWRF